MTGDVLEVLGFGNVKASFLSTVDDRTGERVFAAAFGRRREPEDVVFVPPLAFSNDPTIGSGSLLIEGNHVGQFHLALGERPRLVEDDGVDVLRAFQYVATFEQDAVLCADRRPDHRRRWRRQSERTGASDQHRGSEDDDRELED